MILAPTHPAYSLRGEILCLLSANRTRLKDIATDLGMTVITSVRAELLKLVDKRYPVTMFTDPVHGRCVRLEASTRGEELKAEAEAYYDGVYGGQTGL